MPSDNKSLDLLRQDIDSIDVAIHELIVRRGTIVEEIKKIKNGVGPALRPGREALIMRQLSERHKGSFPLSALFCMWREMLSGFTQMQAPLTVAVYAAPGFDWLMALSRNHYGSMTPLLPQSTATACVRAVADKAAHVAVLPLPADGEAESWWPLLIARGESAPRVVSRLPFLFDRDGEAALVIAQSKRDLSQDETSLIALRLSERTSRSRILSSIVAAGFTEVVSLASTESEYGDCFHVLEVADDVLDDDGRLMMLQHQLSGSLIDCCVIGGYARPLNTPRNSD